MRIRRVLKWSFYLLFFFFLPVWIGGYIADLGGRERDVLYARAELVGGLEEGRLLVATEDQLLLHGIYGRKAYDAEERFPSTAKKIYLLFGGVPEFDNAVYRWGHQAVLPIIDYFVENESAELQLRQNLGDAFTRFFGGESRGSQKLSPEERVFIALALLDEQGFSFAGQFAYDPMEQKTKRLAGERIFQTIKSLAVGNILSLERKHKEGSKVGWGDIGLAATDLAVLALAGGAGAAAFRSAKLATTGAKTASVATKVTLASKLAFMKSVVFLKTVKYTTIGAGIYMIWYHPKAVNRVVGEAAEMVGLDADLIRSLFWAVVTLVVLIILYAFFAPILWFRRRVIG